MIYSADGRRLYSPRDLVAYLEGDFAAWCERMQAERGRAGAAGADLRHVPLLGVERVVARQRGRREGEREKDRDERRK
jgi:hypothetical protein